MTDVTEDPKKRSFLTIATGAMLGVGACAAAWPMVRQMSPSADIEQPLEVEFLGLKEGESKLLKWRGNPFVLRHRTTVEIEQTRTVDVTTLTDRLARNESLHETSLATVENRSFGPDGRYVLMSLVCTHLGCLLNENSMNLQDSMYKGGLYCNCHGATFDSLGRVYKPPARTNLPIPKFAIKSDHLIVIGTEVSSS